MTTLQQHLKEERIKRAANINQATQIYLDMKKELLDYIDELKLLNISLEKNFICHNKVPYVVDNYLPVLDQVLKYHNTNSVFRFFYNDEIKKLYKIAPRIFHTKPNVSCVLELERYKNLTRLIKNIKYDIDKFERVYSHIVKYHKTHSLN